MIAEITLGGWEQYGVAGLVFTVALFVLRWTDAHQKDWLKGAQARITDLERRLDAQEAETRTCERRTEILLGALRTAGIAVPAAYWDAP